MNPTHYDRDHNDFTVRDVVASYNTGAPTLAPEYEGLPFEKIHAPVLDLLPDAGACVLDMGAGTGRDSAWFAANGYNVVAAEPAAAMRDAGLVRGLGRRLRESGTRLYCVWTMNRLKSDFDIDHCFPFAAWPCNDLWNLLPSAPAVNRSKGDRLPAAEALERSRSWILEWWDLAYRRDIVLRNQFEDEARSALPAAVFGLEESVTPEDVFEGLMVQQMVLKRDQQLAVWRPSPP